MRNQHQGARPATPARPAGPAPVHGPPLPAAASLHPPLLSPAAILALQRLVGNHAVADAMKQGSRSAAARPFVQRLQVGRGPVITEPTETKELGDLKWSLFDEGVNFDLRTNAVFAALLRESTVYPDVKALAKAILAGVARAGAPGAGGGPSADPFAGLDFSGGPPRGATPAPKEASTPAPKPDDWDPFGASEQVEGPEEEESNPFGGQGLAFTKTKPKGLLDETVASAGGFYDKRVAPTKAKVEGAVEEFKAKTRYKVGMGGRGYAPSESLLAGAEGVTGDPLGGAERSTVRKMAGKALGSLAGPLTPLAGGVRKIAGLQQINPVTGRPEASALSQRIISSLSRALGAKAAIDFFTISIKKGVSAATALIPGGSAVSFAVGKGVDFGSGEVKTKGASASGVLSEDEWSDVLTEWTQVEGSEEDIFIRAVIGALYSDAGRGRAVANWAAQQPLLAAKGLVAITQGKKEAWEKMLKAAQLLNQGVQMEWDEAEGIEEEEDEPHIASSSSVPWYKSAFGLGGRKFNQLAE
ncbi:MAG: hypothetical protein QOH36_1252 [Actinomycetota bacterium]|nr:hypothetical protein [Actinomycetota bacterium]